MREGEQEEGSSTESVDREERGEGKDEAGRDSWTLAQATWRIGMPVENSLDGAETQRCTQRLARGVSTGLDEDGGRVEGDNVDLQCRTIDQRQTAYQVTVDFTHSAHLLRQHDGMRSQSSASDSRDSEQLGNPPKESRWLGELGLLSVLIMDGIEVPSGLQFAETETFERFESFLVATLFDEPSSGFGAEVDSEGERHGGDHGASELEPPVGDNQAEEREKVPIVSTRITTGSSGNRPTWQRNPRRFRKQSRVATT